MTLLIQYSMIVAIQVYLGLILRASPGEWQPPQPLEADLNGGDFDFDFTQGIGYQELDKTTHRNRHLASLVAVSPRTEPTMDLEPSKLLR